MPHPRAFEPTVISTPAEFEEALELRYAVFCDEQRIPREIERDAEDDLATHVLIRDETGRVVATGRALRQLSDGRLVALRDLSLGPAQFVRVGRMAVLREARRGGLGAKVMTALEREAVAAGLQEAMLHAQLTAAPFYSRCGYSERGEVFMEADIPHVEMVKKLTG